MSKRAELRLCYGLHLTSYATFLCPSSLEAKGSFYDLKFSSREKLAFGVKTELWMPRAPRLQIYAFLLHTSTILKWFHVAGLNDFVLVV